MDLDYDVGNIVLGRVVSSTPIYEHYEYDTNGLLKCYADADMGSIFVGVVVKVRVDSFDIEQLVVKGVIIGDGVKFSHGPPTVPIFDAIMAGYFIVFRDELLIVSHDNDGQT